MKKLFLLCLTVFLLLSCMDVEVKIKLNPDGSGIIEKKIMMSKEVVEMLKGFSAPAETEGTDMEGTDMEPAQAPFSLLNEEELISAAAAMGEGVEYRESRELSNDTQEGYIVVYSFKDISKVKINQNPAENMPGEGAESNSEFLLFEFSKAASSNLKVIFPVENGEETAAQENTQGAAIDENQIMMMKQMFKDMRIAISVEINGKIEKTDASYAQGSTVTLMEINFNEILNNDEKLKELASMQAGSVEGMKDFIKDMPGIKIESKKKIEVAFK